MAVVTVVVGEVPTAVVAAATTAVVATVAVASTVVALVVAASMADRPTAVAITAVGIAAACMAVDALEIPALDWPGRLSAEACGTVRPDSIRLLDRGAEACRQLVAQPWVRLAAREWPQGTSHASLTGIFILSAASTPLDRLSTRRSTMLALWEPAA